MWFMPVTICQLGSENRWNMIQTVQRSSCKDISLNMSSAKCQPFWSGLNTLRPRQNGGHFADDTFIRIFLNENVRISIWISLKFVPKGPINNIPALVQIMAWCRPGDKPLSEPMMVRLPMHICVTRPQWVNVLPHLTLDKMADNNFMNGNDRIPIRISLKFVPMGPIGNKQASVQVMAWRWTGDNLLPEPMLTQFTDTYMQH